MICLCFRIKILPRRMIIFFMINIVTTMGSICVYDTDTFYSKTIPNVTSYSNLETNSCEMIADTYDEGTPVNTKIIKHKRFFDTKISHCLIEIVGSTLYCGSNLITTYQIPGMQLAKQRIDVSKEECEQLVSGNSVEVPYEYGSAKGNVTLNKRGTGIKQVLLGKRLADGACEGAAFITTENKLFKSIIYEVEARIVARQELAIFNKVENSITTPNIIKVKVNKHGSNRDEELGQFFYNYSVLPKDSCAEFRLIHEGLGLLYKPKSESGSRTVISTRDKHGSIITLLLEDKASICNNTGHSTNEDDIFVLIGENIKTGDYIKTVSSSDVSDFDQLNARVSTIYIELVLKLQEDFQLYLYELCKAKEMSMLSHLSMMAGNRGLMYNYLPGSPMGIEVSNQGAVTYFIYGTKMNASLRSIDECCSELPISLLTEDGSKFEVFADPITSVIKPYCTQRICDSTEPYVYRVEFCNETSGHIRYLCTKGTPTISMCEAPSKLSIRLERIKSAIPKLQKKFLNPSAYSKKDLQSHHLNKLIGNAKISIDAETAHNFVRESPVQLPLVLSSNLEGSAFERFRKGVIEKVVPYFSGFWMSVISTLVGGMLTTLLCYVFFKLLVCLLKRSSHGDLPVKKYGIKLGESRVFKNISQRCDTIVSKVSKLAENRHLMERRLDESLQMIEELRSELKADKAKKVNLYEDMSSSTSECV